MARHSRAIESAGNELSHRCGKYPMNCMADATMSARVSFDSMISTLLFGMSTSPASLLLTTDEQSRVPSQACCPLRVRYPSRHMDQRSKKNAKKIAAQNVTFRLV